MSTSVVTLGTSTWELVDRLERLHGEVTVVRRCLELSELLACSHTGMADVAVVAEGAEELTTSMLRQLADNHLRVLVVEGHDSHRLAGLGVAAVPAGASGEELSRRVREAVAAPAWRPTTARGGSDGGDPPDGSTAPGVPGSAAGGRGPRPPGDGPRGGDGAGAREAAGDVVDRGDGADDAARTPRAPEAAEQGWEPDSGARSAQEEEVREHRLVAVWGPAGAPGRTVTALNVAAEAALLGHRVLLVDADTYAASVAASLGLLDEAAGLAQACRLADQGRLDAPGLARCVTRVSVAGGSVDVLTGITRHDRWPELRGSALDLVLERAREEYELVVVDTSFNLELDEEITSDFLAPRRNAGTLGAVAAADTVLALGAADVLGVPRLVKALPDLEEAAPDARVVLAVTKLRPAAAGRSAAAAVTEAWERFAPGHGIAHTLVWDPAVCDDALLAGAVLAETAPRSALRQEYTALTRAVVRDAHPEVSGGGGALGATPARTRLGHRMGAWLRRDRT
ncbi:ParA family protein [Kocuria sp.]|uniref:AAA family ATPase n=1 Tax=Kocuria sp. TaxID=1871328 RepID=UPI0026DB80B8|nr:ParA family protein [Kocuria sp.]MDO4918642.1 ParA family protein [Kocuria sp.]